QRRLVIPDLANKNNIRRLTKRAPQAGGKRSRVTSDLSLSEMTATTNELMLDRILNRHYMPHHVLVHPLKDRCDSGGFPLAGWSCHKDEAVLASGPSGEEPLRRSECLQARHAGLDAA